MNAHTHPRFTCRSFTLLELLTVISIISIMIAVLLPSLSGARQRGRITKCQAQLRDLGVAVQAYLQVNQDYYPLVRDCNGNICSYWNGHQYFGWNGTMKNPLGREWNRLLNNELGLELAPAVPDAAKIARCPNDEGAPGQSGEFEPLFDVFGTSYAMNPILVQGRYADWRYRNHDATQSQVISTARKVLLFDHPAFGLTFDGYWTAIRPGWHDQINPAAGVTFTDGHAEYVRGLATLQEWQWYIEAPGPEYTRTLNPKVDWVVLPAAQ